LSTEAVNDNWKIKLEKIEHQISGLEVSIFNIIDCGPSGKKVRIQYGELISMQNLKPYGKIDGTCPILGIAIAEPGVEFELVAAFELDMVHELYGVDQLAEATSLRLSILVVSD
jgi:hypothetical protein